MNQMTDIASREFRRILLIKPSALGDVVHTLPVLVKLRARYPDARIDWLITPENASLVRHHPDLSRRGSFPAKEFLTVRPKLVGDARSDRIALEVAAGRL